MTPETARKLELLADGIEWYAALDKFHMGHWFNTEDGTLEGGALTGCGTSACAAGTALSMFLPPGRKVYGSYDSEAADLLGFDQYDDEGYRDLQAWFDLCQETSYDATDVCEILRDAARARSLHRAYESQ